MHKAQSPVEIQFSFFPERREENGPCRSHLLAAKMVVDRILKYPLEQHGKLGRRFVGIFFGQLEHRILDDIERRFVVSHGVHRLLERTPLDFRKEGRNFLL